MATALIKKRARKEKADDHAAIGEWFELELSDLVVHTEDRILQRFYYTRRTEEIRIAGVEKFLTDVIWLPPDLAYVITSYMHRAWDVAMGVSWLGSQDGFDEQDEFINSTFILPNDNKAREKAQVSKKHRRDPNTRIGMFQGSLSFENE